jgi:hypothetical protein
LTYNNCELYELTEDRLCEADGAARTLDKPTGCFIGNSAFSLGNVTAMAKPAKVHPWEHALTCPLPRDASYHDLTELRDHILDYLRSHPHNFTLDGGDDRDKEIQRAADRLKKISRMIAAVPPEILGPTAIPKPLRRPCKPNARRVSRARHELP